MNGAKLLATYCLEMKSSLKFVLWCNNLQSLQKFDRGPDILEAGEGASVPSPSNSIGLELGTSLRLFQNSLPKLLRRGFKYTKHFILRIDRLVVTEPGII